jgi:hypothetical protein
MKFLKLFALVALLIGVWAIDSRPVNAQTDCQGEYITCLGNAYGAYDTCLTNCSGHIACEVICEMFYDMSVQQCDYNLQLCLNP